jgi:HAD superfamily hydrolase (TIGR01548 family)
VKDLLIFDMDGVLVDVNASYRATIQATVKYFSGYEPTNDEIQDWKNRGGWNDDWLLSTRLIEEYGASTAYKDVVDYFQKLFQGENSDGMILREKWLAGEGLFDRLGEQHHLAVFTGRLRWEANVTLNRFLPHRFTPVIGADDVARTKPDPEGLHKICTAVEHRKCWYIGDTVDDARASRSAGVPFIGIASQASPRRDDLVRLLCEEGAIAVLDDINSLEAALAH